MFFIPAIFSGQPCNITLTAPPNSSIECIGGQITDQNCTFTCDYGFQLFSGSRVRVCQANHTWTGVEPHCTFKHCKSLQNPTNAYVATKDCPTEFTSKCEIECVEGYYMDKNDSQYQVCSVNTTTNEVYWSQPPICKCTCIII